MRMARCHSSSPARWAAEPATPRLVILDLSAAPHVDLQGAQALSGLADELAASGIRLQTVEARSSVRDRLRGVALDAKLGGVTRFDSVAAAVEAFQQADEAQSHAKAT